MIVFDQKLLHSFRVFEVLDPAELDGSSLPRRFPSDNRFNTYRLRDRGLARERPAGLLSSLAVRRDGDLTIAHVSDRFGTEVGIRESVPRVCLSFMLSGGMEMVPGPSGTAVAHDTTALIYRGLSETRFLTQDNNVRMTVWIEEARLHRALEARLNTTVSKPLVFAPSFDWGGGPAAPIGRLVSHLVAELGDPMGLLSEPVALETFTDTLANLMLARLPNNYAERLAARVGVPVPRHLRRAEAFIAAHADRPIALADIAEATGCGLRTLQMVFRQFRDTTPLAALLDARLREARAALRAAGEDQSHLVIARRFGFTNPSRFNAAYHRRFGELPRETRQLG
jgi:AraC-like DNA-binding protein